MDLSFLRDHRKRGKAIEKIGYTERSIFPVLTANELLPKMRSRLLTQRQSRTALKGDDFQNLYGELVGQFAEFVQLLPTAPGYKLAGMLDEGMVRSLLALDVCAKHAKYKKHSLFIYAAFSVALLQDVANVITHQKITACNKKGVFKAEWLPLAGSINRIASNYKIHFTGGQRSNYHDYLTPLLARQIMPEVGFLWLLSDESIFANWLAALQGDRDGAGGLMMILDLIKLEQEKIAKQKLEMMPLDVELEETPETKAGDEFVHWLRDGLGKGDIKVNDEKGFVHHVEEGLLIELPEAYQAFTEKNKKYKNWRVVEKGVKALGLLSLGVMADKTQRYKSDYPVDKKGKLSATGKSSYFASEKSRGGQSAKDLAKRVKEKGVRKGRVISSTGLVLPPTKIPEVSGMLNNLAGYEHFVERLHEIQNSMGAAAPKNVFQL